MFTGSELSTAITAVLIAAVLVGVLLHWIWVAYVRTHPDDAARLDEMATRLHDTDIAREAAEAARQQAEALQAQAEAELAEKLAAMQARLDGAIEGREAELSAALEDAQRELEVMGEGLSNARRRMIEMEKEITELKQKNPRKRRSKT